MNDDNTIQQSDRIRGHNGAGEITESERAASVENTCPDCGKFKFTSEKLCPECAELPEPGHQLNGKFRCLICNAVMPAYQMHSHAEWHRYLDRPGIAMPHWMAWTLKAVVVFVVIGAVLELVTAIAQWISR